MPQTTDTQPTGWRGNTAQNLIRTVTDPNLATGGGKPPWLPTEARAVLCHTLGCVGGGNTETRGLCVRAGILWTLGGDKRPSAYAVSPFNLQLGGEPTNADTDRYSCG